MHALSGCLDASGMRQQFVPVWPVCQFSAGPSPAVARASEGRKPAHGGLRVMRQPQGVRVGSASPQMGRQYTQSQFELGRKCCHRCRPGYCLLALDLGQQPPGQQ